MTFFMRFPHHLAKAMTLSYDDGVETDIRLMDIMKQHGLLGTFNINTGLFAPEGTVYPQGQVHRRMSQSQTVTTYKDSGMEVAVHGYRHTFLEKMPSPTATYEIIKDRECIESLFGIIARGMAYPFGTYNQNVIDILRTCGIAYARTVRSTHTFELPEEPLRLDPTCHHKDPELFNLLDTFLNFNVDRAPKMFYLWGHSYEFDGDNNWHIIEEFAKRAGGHNDVWYATNIQIIDYLNAYRSLLFSADSLTVYNPTATTICFTDFAKHPYEIKSGETLKIKS